MDLEVTPDSFNLNKLCQEKDMQRHKGGSSEEQATIGSEQTLFTTILALVLALAGTRRTRCTGCCRRARAAQPGVRAYPSRVVQRLIP